MSSPFKFQKEPSNIADILVMILFIIVAVTLVAWGFNEAQEDTNNEANQKVANDAGAIYGNVISIDSYEPVWTELWFEDGVLYIENQDGKWFIELKEVID